MRWKAYLVDFTTRTASMILLQLSLPEEFCGGMVNLVSCSLGYRCRDGLELNLINDVAAGDLYRRPEGLRWGGHSQQTWWTSNLVQQQTRLQISYMLQRPLNALWFNNWCVRMMASFGQISMLFYLSDYHNYSIWPLRTYCVLYDRWKPRVVVMPTLSSPAATQVAMMQILSSPVAPQVIITTTYSATCGDKLCIVATFGIPCDDWISNTWAGWHLRYFTHWARTPVLWVTAHVVKIKA